MALRATPDQRTAVQNLLQDTGHTQPFADYLGLEVDADMLLHYNPVVIPGTFQTRDYARLCIDGASSDLTPRQRAAKLDLRMLRQEIITQRGVVQNGIIPLHVLQDLHAAATREAYDPMAREQLAMLARAASAAEPAIDLRVVDLTGIRRAGTGMAALTIALVPNGEHPNDLETVACIENPVGGSLEIGSRAAMCEADFQNLGRFAMESDESRRIIQRMAV